MDKIAKIKAWISEQSQITRDLVDSSFEDTEELVIAYSLIESLNVEMAEIQELVSEIELSERIDKYSHDEFWFKIFLETGDDNDAVVIKEILSRKKQNLIAYVKDLAESQKDDADNIYATAKENNFFENDLLRVVGKRVSLYDNESLNTSENSGAATDTLAEIEQHIQEKSADKIEYQSELGGRIYQAFKLHEDFEFSEHNRKVFLENLRQALTLIEEADLSMYSKTDLHINIFFKDSGQNAEAMIEEIFKFFNVSEVKMKETKLLTNSLDQAVDFIMDDGLDYAAEFLKLIPGINTAISVGKISYKTYKTIKSVMEGVQEKRGMNELKKYYDGYIKESKLSIQEYHRKCLIENFQEIALRVGTSLENLTTPEVLEPQYRSFINPYLNKAENVYEEIKEYLQPLAQKTDIETASYLIISHIEFEGREQLKKVQFESTF